ncbi:helix-turn-helix domain-containing protein [Pusillimonas sp. SM2304]|uniref:helix-turn-helix domain-containing protein n=1 Tax=Pusillimonas sp. SM2304 TaxID=3073241 RepID=UPI0028740777|nr:helix-turn-helix domain-containing protein [Pusillimonas sp. SM2304]MDS1139198.1 helix-turn-helix domain-containing protein [Pusillimonas sp. SM2304]
MSDHNLFRGPLASDTSSAKEATPRQDAAASVAWSQGIAQKLRQRRKVKRLSLKALAEKAGLSIGLLSQIERGVSTPSLRSLSQVCQALEMPMAWLFDRDHSLPIPEPSVVRLAQRRRMDLGSGGMIKEILSPDSISDIQLMRFVIHSGGKSGDSPAQHPTGAKCGTVLAGCLGLEINGQEHIINQHDSFAFKANAQYRFWAVGDADCEVIWAVTPALY